MSLEVGFRRGVDRKVEVVCSVDLDIQETWTEIPFRIKIKRLNDEPSVPKDIPSKVDDLSGSFAPLEKAQLGITSVS